mmetsp:Transcript_2344/g.5053  ORF Transcript_2344/g.5053 Transcript_2344/m.5053 type:complete len:216 (-) Transcript_2344:943-1590(-)
MQCLDAHATSTAYVLMYMSSRRRIDVWYAETSVDSNAYRGELLGLLALHLLLEQAHQVYGQPSQPTSVYSDWKSAIHKISHLNADRSPIRLCQIDVLKLLCLAQSCMAYPPKLLHVQAHQDDHSPIKLCLSRPDLIANVITLPKLASSCLSDTAVNDITNFPRNQSQFSSAAKRSPQMRAMSYHIISTTSLRERHSIKSVSSLYTNLMRWTGSMS